MVKNTKGGNKSKGFARKEMVKRDRALRIAEEEGEIYAQAVKVLGGKIASVVDLKGTPLRAHIRGKFSGRGKRDNFISPGSWLLVGLHSWEGDTSGLRNCDILEVYSDADKIRLKNTVTNVNWAPFIATDTKQIGCSDKEPVDNDVIFADETTIEYEELIAKQQADLNNSDKTSPSSNIITDDGDIIDVDEI